MQIDHRPPDTVGAKALADARKTFGVGFGYAGLLSMFIGLLSLTVPLFTMQLYDRVMASQSLDTLTMLAMLAMIGLLLYGTLDFIRALTFQSIASMMLRGLNPVALRAAVASSATSGAAHASQALRDLHEIRSFLTGGAIATPLDAAWTPLYFVVLFALHPMYGLIGILSVALMVATGLASDVLTRRSLQRASSSSLETVAEVAGSLRHAEAMESMGMLPALARRWTHKQDMSLDLFDAATLRGRAMASFTRIARQAMQIATLSAGIVLVIQHDVSPGTLLAASIIMGRLLGPFEGVVDNLRQWIGAQMAWRRICTLVEHEAPQRDTKATPANRGDLVVDRLVYAPPGAEIPVLKGVSFRLSPGEVLGVIGASAAGKSTLARTLVGVLKPTAGGVYLDGQGTFLWEREILRQGGWLPAAVRLAPRRQRSRQHRAHGRDGTCGGHRGGETRRYPRHDWPAAVRLRDAHRREQPARVRRPAPTHCAGSRAVRKSRPAGPRRA